MIFQQYSSAVRPPRISDDLVGLAARSSAGRVGPSGLGDVSCIGVSCRSIDLFFGEGHFPAPTLARDLNEAWLVRGFVARARAMRSLICHEHCLLMQRNEGGSHVARK